MCDEMRILFEYLDQEHIEWVEGQKQYDPMEETIWTDCGLGIKLDREGVEMTATLIEQIVKGNLWIA